MRVLVVADDELPIGSAPARPGGLRAAVFRDGLQAHGASVEVAVRRKWTTGPIPEWLDGVRCDPWVKPAELTRLVERCGPDVVVNCSHPAFLGAASSVRTVVQDSFGVRWLEGEHWRPGSAARLIASEVIQLGLADAFTAATKRQVAGLLPLLGLAGIDLRKEGTVFCVPHALRLRPPSGRRREPKVIFAGSLLPWQKSLKFLAVAAEEARSCGGWLQVIVRREAQFPGLTDVEVGLQSLAREHGASISWEMDYENYLLQVETAAAALDVFEPTPERLVASPTRTLEYLRCGVPVIVSRDAEMASLVEQFRAGWATNPNRPEEIAGVVREALKAGGEDARRQAARHLVEDEFDPSRAVEGVVEELAKRAEATDHPECSRRAPGNRMNALAVSAGFLPLR